MSIDELRAKLGRRAQNIDHLLQEVETLKSKQATLCAMIAKYEAELAKYESALGPSLLRRKPKPRRCRKCHTRLLVLRLVDGSTVVLEQEALRVSGLDRAARTAYVIHECAPERDRLPVDWFGES